MTSSPRRRPSLREKLLKRLSRIRALPLLPLLAICVALSTSRPAVAADDARRTREYDLKAVFLLNFAEFVDWPVEALGETERPFVIGVLGDDPFGRGLDEVVANESVRGHKLVVRRSSDAADLLDCHVIFVSRSGAPPPERVFELFSGRSVLTVGDTDAFAEKGGMVRFLVVDNRLRLQINVAAVDLGRLTMSSKLLRQADLIRASR